MTTDRTVTTQAELDAAAFVLSPIMRPNGLPYRPRKLAVYAVTDCHGDELEGVVVFGTHEHTVRAQSFADQYVAWQLDSGYCARNPRRVWWRDGFEMGQRRWVDDPVRGRAGLLFEIAEVAS